MIGVVFITLIALVLGIILVLTDLFINKKNDLEEEYLKRLPGYNCGSCGYGSCKGMAEAMCKDKECYKKCRPLRGDNLKQMEEFINNN